MATKTRLHPQKKNTIEAIGISLLIKQWIIKTEHQTWARLLVKKAERSMVLAQVGDG